MKSYIPLVALFATLVTANPLPRSTCTFKTTKQLSHRQLIIATDNERRQGSASLGGVGGAPQRTDPFLSGGVTVEGTLPGSIVVNAPPRGDPELSGGAMGSAPLRSDPLSAEEASSGMRGGMRGGSPPVSPTTAGAVEA